MVRGCLGRKKAKEVNRERSLAKTEVHEATFGPDSFNLASNPQLEILAN